MVHCTQRVFSTSSNHPTANQFTLKLIGSFAKYYYSGEDIDVVQISDYLHGKTNSSFFRY
uniref:Uncharacterized protein n=1 Tax=Triticum urartu TaxID=4572 RepID=A0A8R7Q4M2_TRIUA